MHQKIIFLCSYIQINFRVRHFSLDAQYWDTRHERSVIKYVIEGSSCTINGFPLPLVFSVIRDFTERLFSCAIKSHKVRVVSQSFREFKCKEFIIYRKHLWKISFIQKIDALNREYVSMKLNINFLLSGILILKYKFWISRLSQISLIISIVTQNE